MRRLHEGVVDELGQALEALLRSPRGAVPRELAPAPHQLHGEAHGGQGVAQLVGHEADVPGRLPPHFLVTLQGVLAHRVRNGAHEVLGEDAQLPDAGGQAALLHDLEEKVSQGAVLADDSPHVIGPPSVGKFPRASLPTARQAGPHAPPAPKQRQHPVGRTQPAQGLTPAWPTAWPPSASLPPRLASRDVYSQYRTQREPRRATACRSGGVAQWRSGGCGSNRSLQICSKAPGVALQGH